MYLRVRKRKKNGKTHRYWSVVESRRISGGRIIQKQLLYLGELNDVQHTGWVQAINALQPVTEQAQQLALFPDDVRELPVLNVPIVQIRIDQIRLARPRQWGACWLAFELWDMLKLDAFWRDRLDISRKGTDWLCVLKTLVAYRLVDPGSEYRLHRQWFDQTAVCDLLNTTASIVSKNTWYRCLDHLLAHRDALFSHLTQQWRDLFNARYDMILYDLTSTYFECDPPETSGSKKQFGYSRDRRFDCVQVVIGLVVTPQGLPLGYEIFPGNTRDTSTLRTFLDRIESHYGKRDRLWLMDRGIPTEETLEEMRTEKAFYLVGTPKGRLSKLEKQLLQLPWHQARQQVRVKLLETEGEFYVYVESADRLTKERAMRRRRLKRLLARLKEIQQIKKQTRDELLLRLGEARKQAGRAWYLVTVQLPDALASVNPDSFRFHLNRKKLRRCRRREGRYLLRSNLTEEDPAHVWEKYLLLTHIEQAFKEVKGDMLVRPIYHQKEKRIEAHIFVSFLAYCLFVTLRNRLRPSANGLTSRSVFDVFHQIQMVDVHLPTTDGRTILLQRYTEPSPEVQLLLDHLGMHLPNQPPPRIYSQEDETM